jgi:hypothetical protein
MNPGRPVRHAPGIEPLTEAEFDELANQLADELTTLLKRHDYRLPAVIASPQVDPGGVEDAAVAGTFAHRLANGLNDRMRGGAFFRKFTLVPPQLRCTLRFARHERDARRSKIEFRVLDEHSGEERLAKTYAYESSRPATGARTRRAPSGTLRIDAPANEIGKAALHQAPVYRPWTITGHAGRVIFLDSRGWQRFWLHAQRATRTGDGRLRVELEIRARRCARDARLRLIFYDDEFKAVDMTPALSYRFPARSSRQVSFTSADPRAAHYICLFAGE